MILAVAATQMELDALPKDLTVDGQAVDVLVSGVGPVESAVRLVKYLSRGRNVQLVVNFGVGGAYLQPSGQKQPALLDLCLAATEVLGDLGISTGDSLSYLDEQLTGPLQFPLDYGHLQRAMAILDALAVRYRVGPFVTVNAASGSEKRGRFLQNRWQGICENMEGAALARVCREFQVPLLELRAISNLVEDRDPAGWRLGEAATKAGRAAAGIIKELIDG